MLQCLLSGGLEKSMEAEESAFYSSCQSLKEHQSIASEQSTLKESPYIFTHIDQTPQRHIGILSVWNSTKISTFLSRGRGPKIVNLEIILYFLSISIDYGEQSDRILNTAISPFSSSYGPVILGFTFLFVYLHFSCSYGVSFCFPGCMDIVGRNISIKMFRLIL